MDDLIPDSPEVANMIQHIPCEPECFQGCEPVADHPDFRDPELEL